MLDVWSWISQLPLSQEWQLHSPSSSFLIFELATSQQSPINPTPSLHLRAERTTTSLPNSTPSHVTLSVCLRGFSTLTPSTVWVSHTFPLDSDQTNTNFLLPLLLQLLQEIITRAPTSYNSTCPRSHFQKLRPEPVSWIIDSHSPESFSNFFNLVFLTRLFWSCALDAPCEVGSFYLDSLLGPNIHSLLAPNHAPVLRKFLVSVGADAELSFMRTLGYMLAKWLISRDVRVGPGLRSLVPLIPNQQHELGFSYATEAHGFWTLKGYAPIPAMRLSRYRSNDYFHEPNDAVLKYALAHQQLEAVIQLEYSVTFHDTYIQVSARVDNLRFQVAKLGFNKSDDVEYMEERHFVSRVRAWVGPEIGATYIAGLSLGRSTHNGESETTEQQILTKDNLDNLSTRRARKVTRMRSKDWRWDQDVEGNAVIFDAVLYDSNTCREYYSSGGPGGDGPKRMGNGPNRPFTKTRGLIFGGDEYGNEVVWRVGKEMEGSVLKWRIGGQVWVSYFPNQVKTSYFETRCVEWCDEVDLPLIPAKYVD
ncbi:hypothetical protein LINPERPRIM_LOCUS20159 [Linum perenne]